MTPIHFLIENRLKREYEILDREKITHWLVCWSSKLKIEDCRGRSIQYEGIKFEGSPRDVFWNFLEPCLEDTIIDVLKTTDLEARRFEPAVAREALNEAVELLKLFLRNIYQRMVHVDQALRGDGRPNSVAPYDPSGNIARLSSLIESAATSYIAQIGAAHD